MTSRLPRVEFDHAFYHITARGNNRQNIFLEEKDFTRFLFELVRVVREYDWRCYAYCLMTNHYHLTIQTIQPNLSLGMRTLHMRYSKYFREQHVFTGSLFENRYDSSMISDDAYVLEAIRYDLINPVAMRKRLGLKNRQSGSMLRGYDPCLMMKLCPQNDSSTSSQWA